MLSVSIILLSLEVVAVWQVMILGIPCHVDLANKLCLPKLGFSYIISHEICTRFCCGLSSCFGHSCNLYTHILQKILHWHWAIVWKICANSISTRHYHIEVETKWLPFSRRHFQMHFHEWKCMNLTEIVRLNWNLFLSCKLTIFHHWLRFGLVSTRRQSIIWTNNG